MDTAIFFSGGKDSLALLHMYRAVRDGMYVIWANPGAPYASTVKMMDEWRAKLPHFIEVNGNQPQHIERYGYPVDVLPINYGAQAKALYGSDSDVKLQSYLDCCAANLWQPVALEVKRLGVKRVICAFRRDESYDNMTRGDTVIDGVEYIFPLMTWTEAEVFAYLKEHSVALPEEYARGEKKSRDCWNCTAWLHEDVERIRNLPPEQRTEMKRRLTIIADLTQRATKHLDNALRSANA